MKKENLNYLLTFGTLALVGITTIRLNSSVKRMEEVSTSIARKLTCIDETLFECSYQVEDMSKNIQESKKILSDLNSRSKTRNLYTYNKTPNRIAVKTHNHNQ